MRMLTRRLGQSILWATATSVALGAPSSNAVEWKAYRFYFPNSINAMGLWRSSSADRPNERTFDVVLSSGVVSLLGTVFQAAFRGSRNDNALSANSRASD